MSDRDEEVRRWFLVCHQFRPYPLDVRRRELAEGKDDYKKRMKKGDTLPEKDFEIQKCHLKPMNIICDKQLIDLGKLADYHVHQVVKQELVRIVFKIAWLYYWGHPAKNKEWYHPLKASAVTDMEQNSYQFYFVPEKSLLDEWHWIVGT